MTICLASTVNTERDSTSIYLLLNLTSINTYFYYASLK